MERDGGEPIALVISSKVRAEWDHGEGQTTLCVSSRFRCRISGPVKESWVSLSSCDSAASDGQGDPSVV